MYNISKTIITLIIVTLFLPPLITNSQKAFYNKENEVVKYIRLPLNISKSDLLQGKQEIKKSLHQYAKSKLKDIPRDSISRKSDIIIVFTDENDVPILPDNENRNYQKNKPNLLSGNEITFTFNSKTEPWSDPQKAILQQFVNDFYLAIKNLIGDPFFNITVNISLDNTIPYAGLYNSSTNEIVLSTLSDHIICHEIIHAFRDDLIMSPSTYEEGMTRASEVEVFNQLTNYTWPSNDFHSDPLDYFYEGLNSPEIAAYNGDLFSNISHSYLRYQLASYIWSKAYLEDSNFLKRFNDSLYSQTLNDPSTRYTESKLRNIFEIIKPTVENLTNNIWYGRQFLLNTNPTFGYKLYQRVNQFTIDFFERNEWVEKTQDGATISWELLDHNNNLLSSGNGITTSFGWIDYSHPFPDGYFGKIKLIASVQSPVGLIHDTAYRIQMFPEQGIFGVVEDANLGSVSITPLDTPMLPVTKNLLNGAFSFPEFEKMRGRFRYVFTYPDNRVVSRIFTKDRSLYYVLIKNDPKTYWVGTLDNSWHNPLNWSGGIVPGEYSNVIINSVTPFPCIITEPAICRSLQLSNNITFTANNNLLIRH